VKPIFHTSLQDLHDVRIGPTLEQLIEAAEGQNYAFYAFPFEHRCQIYNTNPLRA
jgi:hypothetical protein